jgi:hypothetical protein
MNERKTVTLDIEAMDSTWLTDYQKTMLVGYNANELMTISAGRATGKSSYYQYWIKEGMQAKKSPFTHVETVTVDDEPWHTVLCNRDTAIWIRGQNHKSWYEHLDLEHWSTSKFDISDKLYTMLRVGFSV